MNHEEFHMSNYRPAHQPWHDKIPIACTCLPGWSTREMVDPGCEYHCVIEVLDEYGFGELLGETLYRIDWFKHHWSPVNPFPATGSPISKLKHKGVLVMARKSNGVAYAETDEEGVPDSDVNGG